MLELDLQPSRTPKSKQVSADVTCRPLEETSTDITHRGAGRVTAKGGESQLLAAENQLLREEVNRLAAADRYKAARLTFSQISESDALVNYYTSLPNAKVFKTLVTYISMLDFEYYQHKVDVLVLEDQILMFLMKLRHNFGHTDLSVRFAVSMSTVTNILRTFISVFAEALYKPVLGKGVTSREKNRGSMPASFEKFQNCRTTIDCTEIHIQKPDNTNNKASTYSAYKARNTFKLMVGVAPNGTINFVSGVYGGNASDKQIAATSGLLEQLDAGDLVLADKGFSIGDIVPTGVTVNTPAFLFQPQFTKEEVLHNREVAEARIHVERAIARLKLYKILDAIPHQFRNIVNALVKVCAVMTTFQNPIIAQHRLMDRSK
ncbi:uncharacterized protein LOC122380206 [Amphibalanus amphitrite]|uniref:uncharacterized protein LOC122380206 n=1 Tax=Amphibalanus amphitrite TaxID=1232801 RepID=UPI001C8FB45D|nr:uncharacterized protein LOC122380206 [Amphibalanus amphitrite]